jgi:hypothetical protein
VDDLYVCDTLVEEENGAVITSCSSSSKAYKAKTSQRKLMDNVLAEEEADNIVSSIG